MTAKEPTEPVIEFVGSIAWSWVALAFALGIVGGIAVLAIIARSEEPGNA
jgi:hypothetical protein